MKKILIVWVLVAVILVGGLTFLGFKIKEQNKPYRTLENKLEETAIGLIGEKPNILNSSNKITLEDFTNNGYEINMTVNGDKCDGYVVASKTMSFYKYTAYIKCSNYTTAGY